VNKSVLDASAFLAYLRDEPGAEIVENALIDGCYISIINWVEVLSKVVDLGESQQN
jgi:ribonuclease VapC